jgi:hypothetical protein
MSDNIDKRLQKYGYQDIFKTLLDNKIMCQSCESTLGDRKSAWDSHLKAFHPNHPLVKQ